ncbi:MAG: hypothetical protein ACJ73D_09450 [Pyrinomonadaceae bacterium]
MSQSEAVLRPGEPAYEDAVKFAKVLKQAGVDVKGIYSSKLNGFFKGVDRAAFYTTDKGAFEVIFLPNRGAENIKVTETRDGKRHVYSFTGQPHPNPPGDTFNSAEPMYFVAHDNAFIVITSNKKLFETLMAGLHQN